MIKDINNRRNDRQHRAFVVAAFGDRRKQVSRLVENISKYSDLPIHIITTKDSNIGLTDVVQKDGKWVNEIIIHLVKLQWNGYREGQRNSNYYKIKFALNHQCDSLCLLDDDMLIVNENFIDGFAIAEKFGAAVPINPRTFQRFNAMGADVHQKDLDEIKDWPQYMTACNFSPFFVQSCVGCTSNYLLQLAKELIENTCRVTLAMWKASWKTGYSPVILPEQWCVCGSNAKHIKGCTELLRGRSVNIPAIMLHLGHDAVRNVYGV